MSIAPLRPKTQRRLEDRELNQARSKPDTVNRPVRTARIFVHHYNSTQYCNIQFLFIFSFLQTNITSQMWPTGGKGAVMQQLHVPCGCSVNMEQFTARHHVMSSPLLAMLKTVLFTRSYSWSFACAWQFSSHDSRLCCLFVWCPCSLLTLCHHNQFICAADDDDISVNNTD